MAIGYDISVECSSSPLYMIEVHDGTIISNSNKIAEVPKTVACRGEWGDTGNTVFLENECTEIPTEVELIYLSYSECIFYFVNSCLSKASIECFCHKYSTNVKLIIGMVPYGGVAVWVSSTNKSVLINWLKGEKIKIKMEEFLPYNQKISLKEYCYYYINSNSAVKRNLEKNGLPPCDLFDNYMKQFTYRYWVMMERWKGDDEEMKWEKYQENEENVPKFEWIEESLCDGTHDKLHDGELIKYHEAGKPKKWAVQFRKGKTEYTAYFWFEDEKIREVFDRFYGVHPETKTDFIIRIDGENRKYELALYRYGLKEPMMIKEDVYQLLVFKNKFEDYRSENYNQERGAWIW